MPDENTGKQACAVVVIYYHSRPASLRKFLKSAGTARFKVPEQVIIRDAIPTNNTGKGPKHQIRNNIDIQQTSYMKVAIGTRANCGIGSD
ncbi:cyclohexanecarboxylate-CoA ligase [Mycobacterium lepromatosis]|uniref:cyclohexanecarboxylate-CoA ligase n=1 Tax=Mycobacterium lepromatosis TaxID=480418 RepID=UPI000AEB8C1D